MVGIVVWEGVSAEDADHLYDYISNTLPDKGHETERRCGVNEK